MTGLIWTSWTWMLSFLSSLSFVFFEWVTGCKEIYLENVNCVVNVFLDYGKKFQSREKKRRRNPPIFYLAPMESWLAVQLPPQFIDALWDCQGMHREAALLIELFLFDDFLFWACKKQTQGEIPREEQGLNVRPTFLQDILAFCEWTTTQRFLLQENQIVLTKPLRNYQEILGVWDFFLYLNLT